MMTYEEINEKVKKIDKLEAQIYNLIYELKDPRTLENIKLPKIMTKEETLKKLINSNCSICRFGDGELAIMFEGRGYHFQKAVPELRKRLKEVLESKDDNILIGLHNGFGNLDIYKRESRSYFWTVSFLHREDIYNSIDFSRTYYDAMLTRGYEVYKAPIEETTAFFNEFKTLWQNKDIVIVEGEGTRSGLGNDLYESAKSIERILCPAEQAFDKYDEILNECKKINKDKMVLICLGPTATILAYDMGKLGYQALDIGHLDIEYEWFKSQIKSWRDRHPIPGRYMHEIVEYRFIPPVSDPEYHNQIIAKIL